MNDRAKKSPGPLPVHQPTYGDMSLTSNCGLGGEGAGAATNSGYQDK